MRPLFTVTKKSKKSKARTGVLRTAHGLVATPCFMPIATRGGVKAVAPDEIAAIGTQLLLANTYHLWQRPGLAVLKKAGGLHRFMGWSGPVLTDSGGYQVFSLSRRRKISERGAHFISELDGKKYFLTPERAVEIQRVIGSDIMMALDECVQYPASRSYVEQSVALTTRWAARGLRYFRRKRIRNQLLFGIVQGSVYRDLRLRSAREIVALGFDGYAMGGLAVGEPTSEMYHVLDETVPLLPIAQPRYLMGVGKPDQVAQAVARGIDMFDCVIPSRNARHGLLYISAGKNIDPRRKNFFQEIRLKQSRFIRDLRPLDPSCDCFTCRRYSRAYLRHLMMVGDPVAVRLATLHNLRFYLRLMESIRAAIHRGRW